MLKAKMITKPLLEDVEDLDRLDTDYDATEIPIVVMEK